MFLVVILVVPSKDVYKFLYRLSLSEREIGLHLFLYEFWWLNCPTQIIELTSLL
jgi:hypothetical protein